MAVITLTVNGRGQRVDVDPATPLLYVLSDDLGLRGPKFGCGLGQCGACTAIVGTRAVRSCVTPVSSVAGQAITTLEGLGPIDRPHPIQQAFIDEQAAQCGFCLSGVILTAKAFLDQNRNASSAQIREALSGVLCRCFVHTRMMRAIERYARRRSPPLQASSGEARRSAEPLMESAMAGGAKAARTPARARDDQAVSPSTFRKSPSTLIAAASTLSEDRSTLGEGSSTLSEGRSTLGAASSTLSEGRSTLTEGRSTLSEDRSTLSEKSSTLGAASSTLSEDRSTLGEGSSTLSEDRSTLGEGSSTLSEAAPSFSRRAFLKGSGALIVSFAAADAAGAFETAFAQATRPTDGQLDSWIAVGADGFVTVYTGKCELGQGMHTAQTQLVAEELGVSVNRIRLIQCDTSVTPDQGTTSGSQSHPTNFNHTNLALAAATAREALVRLASARLSIAADALEAVDGVVRATGDATKRATFGELIGGRKFNLPLDRSARRKDPRSWTVLGTSVPRVDLPALVSAQLEFVQNVRVPGMLHGAVVRPPEVGATLVSVDEASVRDLPGIVKIVVVKNFVGVVAEKPWQASQAAGMLKVTWTPGVDLPSHSSFYEFLRRQPSRDALVVDSRDVEQKLSQAASVVRATYLHPYQMHGSVGSSCAVADVRADGATIWSSTQAAHALRSATATLLGMPAERVRIVFTRGSGCYGINGADAVSYDAALLSQAAGRPVRVQLSRKDEMAWENYGFAYVIDLRAGLDASGNIIVWDGETWSPSLGGRPGYNAPGNVVTGMLAGFQPATPQTVGRTLLGPPGGRPDVGRTLLGPPSGFNNGSNAAPSYVAGCAGGSCGGTGTVKSERVLTHTIRSPFFTGPLRSPSRLQNTFAHESFIDELAAAAKVDPVVYRLRHLRDPRLIAVINAAAKAANWAARPSPAVGSAPGGSAADGGPNRVRPTGRGFACVLYEGDNGYCAMVAEVDLEPSTGKLVVKRLVSSQDCGPISSPDGMRNQIEGGALQGLSRALGEEVTWDDRNVTSIDWRSYHSLTLGFEVPRIESVLINQPDEEASGAGETTITLVAAAVGNAIFDATGVRIREIPFTAERLKSALAGI